MLFLFGLGASRINSNWYIAVTGSSRTACLFKASNRSCRYLYTVYIVDNKQQAVRSLNRSPIGGSNSLISWSTYLLMRISQTFLSGYYLPGLQQNASNIKSAFAEVRFLALAPGLCEQSV